MTGESFFSLGSAAAGSCLGHDAIHRTEHSLERVARGLQRVEMERDKGGRGVCWETMSFQVSLCCGAPVRDLRSVALNAR